jgi:hypothetical protein
MFKLKDTKGRNKYENGREAKERFANVIKNVPSLKSAEVVLNSEDADESNYTIALICDFETMKDLDEYQVHPAHVEFGKFITGVRESRACIDYEI